MADMRTFEPMVFLVSELPSGDADSPWIERRPGCLRRAIAFENLFDPACCTAVLDCIYMEEIMKQLGLGIVALGLTLPAVADPPFLQGTYGFTGTGICLYALPDFLTGPPPFVAPDGAMPNSGYFTQYFDTQGTVTFNADGTGTSEFSSQGFRLSPQLNIFDPFASASTITSSVSYTPVMDDTFTSNNVPGTFKGTNTAGFGAGSTFATENLPPLTGQISRIARR
jgi:hypothetical protein